MGRWLNEQIRQDEGDREHDLDIIRARMDGRTLPPEPIPMSVHPTRGPGSDSCSCGCEGDEETCRYRRNGKSRRREVFDY